MVLWGNFHNMKKMVPFLLLLFLQGCLTWSWQRDLGTCQEISPGLYGCVIKVPKSSAVVNVVADISFKNEKHSPIKSLRVRIQNEESHEIQIQGMSPNIFLKAGESYEFTVKAGQDANGAGAYICAFNAPVRVRLDISGENLDDAIIKISGMAGDGP